jgi:hypothetical protein
LRCLNHTGCLEGDAGVPGLCAALVDSRLGFAFFLDLLWAAGVGGQTGLSVCCVLLVSVYFLLAWGVFADELAVIIE